MKRNSGKSMKKVLVLGSACVDVIIKIDHLPTTEEDIHPLGQSFSIGGCAFNVAEILRRFGADFVFVCPVGAGLYGDFVKKQLAARGYRDFVEVPGQENGCCYCLVEKSGERTFLSCHGAEYTFDKSWMDSWKETKFDMVYICGLEVEEPTGEQMVEFLESLKSQEIPTCQRDSEIWFAPGPRVMEIKRERLDRIFALHPVLHINKTEAVLLGTYLDRKSEVVPRHLRGNSDVIPGYSGGKLEVVPGCSGGNPEVVPRHSTGNPDQNPGDFGQEEMGWQKAARLIHRVTGNAVIVTLGEDGAYSIDKDGTGFYAEGVRVLVADTIGAGDAHVGTVMAEVSMGENLEEAVKTANRTAALVVGKEGAGLAEEKG